MTEFRNRRALLVALVLGGPLLAGCSSGPSLPSLPTPSFSSLFGSSKPTTDGKAATAETPAADFDCPDVKVRQGAATLTSSSDPADPSAMNLRYQITIGTTARECKLIGNTVSIKVGMQGRVILGPQGTPGPVDVPVRFAVVQEGVDPKTIVTKLDRVAVTVPADDTNMLFSHVAEGLDFPMPRGSAIDDYVIYIGFDPQGLAPEKPVKKKPVPKPAKPRRQG